MNDTPTPSTKGTVLLVDDDKFLVEMYAAKFAREGYTVQACLSAESALEKLRSGLNPDAILFDLIMPERDGFSLLQTLRDEHLGGNAVKIALTNQSDDSEREKATQFGADRYIVKASMIPSEVVNAVGEEIAKKRGK